MHKFARATAAGAVAIVMVVALSGCIPTANMSARMSEPGQVEFGICDDYDVDAIEVSVVDKESHDTQTVWRVEGEIKVRDGDIVTLGQVPIGMEEVIELADFDVSQSYIDFILISHPDGHLVSSAGHFDGADIVDDQWLANSGGYRGQAC